MWHVKMQFLSTLFLHHLNGMRDLGRGTRGRDALVEPVQTACFLQSGCICSGSGNGACDCAGDTTARAKRRVRKLTDSGLLPSCQSTPTVVGVRLLGTGDAGTSIGFSRWGDARRCAGCAGCVSMRTKVPAKNANMECKEDRPWAGKGCRHRILKNKLLAEPQTRPQQRERFLLVHLALAHCPPGSGCVESDL